MQNSWFDTIMQTSLDNSTHPHQSVIIKRVLSILQSPLFGAIFVVAITLAVLSPALTADFVMWDDDITIYKNPLIGVLKFERIFTDVTASKDFVPLTLLSFGVLYRLFALEPFWYHCASWLLFGISAGILFLIIRTIVLTLGANSGKTTPLQLSWAGPSVTVATLLWAIHPLRVEVVAWAVCLAYCQAVFFLFLSIFCYLNACDANVSRKSYFVFMTAAAVLYAASLLSHAIGISFCAVFLVIDFYLFRRIGGQTGWWKSPAARRVILEKALFFLIALLVGVIYVLFLTTSARAWSPPVPLATFGLFARFMQAVYILAYYAYHSLYPIRLSPVYTQLVSFDPAAWPMVLSLLGVAVTAAGVFFIRKRWPLVTAVSLSYVILLVPVLGYFEHPYYPGDRYSLLSSVCFSVFAAAALLYFKKNWTRTLFISGMMPILCLLGLLSVKQAAVWNNSESLFAHTLQTLGDDPYTNDIYMRLGRYLYEKGRTDEAEQNFIRTLQIKPNHPDALYHLAKIEYERGDRERALSYYQRLLQVAPNYFHDNKR